MIEENKKMDKSIPSKGKSDTAKVTNDKADKSTKVASSKTKKVSNLGEDKGYSIAKKAKIEHTKKFIKNHSAGADRTNMIKIVQYKSAIRRDKRQIAVLKSLGLHSGANSVNYLPNTEKVLTQIKAVSHLVRVFKD